MLPHIQQSCVHTSRPLARDTRYFVSCLEYLVRLAADDGDAFVQGLLLSTCPRLYARDCHFVDASGAKRGIRIFGGTARTLRVTCTRSFVIVGLAHSPTPWVASTSAPFGNREFPLRLARRVQNSGNPRWWRSCPLVSVIIVWFCRQRVPCCVENCVCSGGQFRELLFGIQLQASV